MLAFETKDTIIAHGTIFDAEGDGENIKVLVDVVLDGQCVILKPKKEGVTKLTHEVGSHLMWPRHLVLTRNDKETVGFNTDLSTFSSATFLRAPVVLWCLVRLAEHMGSSIQLNTPSEVFSVKRKCCIMVESLRDFSSMQPICTSCLDAYMMYLHTIMLEGRSLSLFKFMDVRSVSYSSYKQSRLQLLNARFLGAEYDQVVLFPYNSGNHWTLVVVNPTKGAAYWIDPLKNQIDGDMSEVLQMSFNISKKKKPNWKVVKYPKQNGVVECEYYGMRFMRDIISAMSTSIVDVMKSLPPTYSQDEIDEVRSELAEFLSKHVHRA